MLNYNQNVITPHKIQIFEKTPLGEMENTNSQSTMRTLYI